MLNNHIIYFLFTVLLGTYAQKTCKTPDDKTGICINYSECPKIINLVNNIFKTAEDIKYMKESVCDKSSSIFKVCCEDEKVCVTPDNTDGLCGPINNCSSLKDYMKPDMPSYITKFMQESHCNPNDQFSVCCSDEKPCVSYIKQPVPEIETLLPKKCGSNPESRIIGGTVAEVDQFPWMGLIEYVKKNNTNLGCGSSLISERYVLTAAHCVVGVVVVKLGVPTSVRFGEFNLTSEGVDCIILDNDTDCTEGTTRVLIEKLMPHPCYKDNLNDLAIIRLQSLVKFTDFIQPICLPMYDVTLEFRTNSVNLTVAGWGTTETDRYSEVKLFALIPYVELETCQKPYKDTIRLFKKQICAGGILGIDSCRGDSGGPLMYENEGLTTLIGVVSFGPTPCGKKNVPGVYTKVFEYVDWIKGEIEP